MSQSKLLKVGLAVVLSLMIQNQSFAQDVTYPLTESGVAPPVTPPSSVSEQEVANWRDSMSKWRACASGFIVKKHRL